MGGCQGRPGRQRARGEGGETKRNLSRACLLFIGRLSDRPASNTQGSLAEGATKPKKHAACTLAKLGAR